MDLGDWQNRLEEHFSALRERRSSELGGEAVFALEHGLAEQEIEDVAAAVRAHVIEGAPCWEHRLPWTVYAAELGYLYSGDEYWQTFEEKTPGWPAHGDRYWIRKCFCDFQEHYGGAKPTGPWARHFSIICWPITHAILPRDLQHQLAKVLFELRHTVTSYSLLTPQRMGELVAVRSSSTSSRFQKAVQEPLLIGQIATALLFREEPTASALILPSTLLRIGQDLERERQARAWMQDAREHVRRHVRFQHRVSIGSGIRAQAENGEDSARQETRLGLEPRLVLRPIAGGEWDVVIELPDFSHVPTRFPLLRDLLSNSRCRVAGSSQRWSARGWLIRGPQKIKLRQWPPAEQPVLQFEQSTGELDWLLRTECLLRPGSIRLFRVASDGLAHELHGAPVRTGNKYVLLSQDEFLEAMPACVTPAVLRCVGIHGLLIEIPDTLTPDLKDMLDKLGVPRTETVEIWPAGLVPARWEGNSTAAWLSTERPCIGVRADHPVKTFVVQMENQVVKVEPGRLGEPVFVELPWLGVGQHTLHVSAMGTGDEPTLTPAVLDIQIREPRRWNPGSSSQSALLVVADPSVPTLEQLWEGDVELEVHGPRGRTVQCSISFYRKGDTVPYTGTGLPPLTIPVSRDAWRAFIKNRIQTDRTVQNAYDSAHRVDVHLRAGEIGAYTIVAEREFAPLRWVVTRRRHAFQLRLINNTGMPGATEVQVYKFDAPDICSRVDAARFCTDEGGDAQAGLYVASAGCHQLAIVTPTQVKKPADFRIEPRIRAYRRSTSDILALLRLLELWGRAHLTGSIDSRFKRRKVLESILREIFGLIGGDRWAIVERCFDSWSEEGEEKAVREAEHSISRRRNENGLGAVLARDARDLASMTAQDRAWRLASLGHRFLSLPNPGNGPDRITAVNRAYGVALNARRPDGPDQSVWLSEFSLRLASCPVGLVGWAGEHAQNAINRLLDVPALARAARFMVLAIQCANASEAATPGLLYDGWEWQ